MAGKLRRLRWFWNAARQQLGDCCLARGVGLDVTLAVDGDLSDVQAAAGEAAYRIVQEALTNVLRHAPTKEAGVSIRVADTLDLEVLDRSEAAGPQADVEEGNGLRGMRERAMAAGGVLSAGRTPAGRWAVQAELPLGRSR